MVRPKSNTTTVQNFVIFTRQSKPAKQDYILYIKN